MLNVDAATFKDPSRIGIGGVIRDHLGDFKMAFCKKMHRVEDPELAEILAIRCGFVCKRTKFSACHCGFRPSKHHKKIQSSHLDRSQVGAIVCDVKNLVCEASLFYVYSEKLK